MIRSDVSDMNPTVLKGNRALGREPDGSVIVNSSRGGAAKDTWVLR
jgi:uncharacterized circularly permuted ATP-grasp superfamily protein